MSAKPKNQPSASDNDSQDSPSDDLEKKIDAMMSVDEPDPTPIAPSPKPITSPEPAASSPVIETPPTPVEPISVVPPPAIDSEKAGAPLLPSTKIPIYKKKITVSDASEAVPTASTPVASEPAPKPSEPEPLEAFEPEEPFVTEPAQPPVTIAEAEASMAATQSQRDELGLEDADTSRAVDEIVAAEADELLTARDGTNTKPVAAAPIPKAKKLKSHRSVKKTVIKIIIFLLIVGVGVVAALPTSRYGVLNAAGIRVGSSVTVLDDSTGQPLRNAEFSIAGSMAKTDKEGKANLDGLKQGKTNFVIKKAAFAELSQPVTLGWGSNPLGEYRIKAVGSQYTFTATDFLSKKPITSAEASSGEASAQSNDKGVMTLTLPQSDEDSVDVQVTADGYRKETIKVTLDSKQAQAVAMVPSKKQPFISKRSGTFDLYKIDVDGKNEEKVLTGTGNERSEAIALATHATKNVAALVSNRSPDGKGTLTIVNLDTNDSSTVSQSARIQLVDWIGDKLIYVKQAENEPENSQKRHQLTAYDLNARSERELASTNYFNDVLVANGSVYYSPAAYQVNGSVGLYKINADGNYRTSIFDKEVWNMFRTSYDMLSVSIGQEWFDLNLANDVMAKAKGAPPVLKSRTYLNSPNNKTSLWIDDRDGKSVLLNYEIDSKKDIVLQSRTGLKNPIRWLDATHVVYRISSTSEIADYVFSTDGGEPRKIRDVTDTAGIDRWYFY